MPSLRHEFTGHNGDKLAARFDRPDGKMHATAVFAHCFSCSKDIHAAKRIATRLCAAGIGVLRFDFTGLGHSDGEFSNTNFSSNLADLELAANYLGEIEQAPELLIGHSLGGSAVLHVAHNLPSVKAVASIGAPYAPEHVSAIFAPKIETIKSEGEAEVNLGGRPFTIKKQFLDDIGAQKTNESIARMRAALLILHSPLDQIVGIENASEIFLKARHPKSFVTLDQADHLLSKPEDADYAANVIAAWAARYVDLVETPDDPKNPEGVVRVSEADAKGFLQDVWVNGEHQLIADEPKSMGGTNQGPTPYQFLSIALGACTSMTIRMYARRKKIALEHVFVDVTHEKAHLAHMEEGKKVDRFTRVIHLSGELDQETRARLVEIANLCPVHKTLEAENVIETYDADLAS